jgi:hypothetical protein
MDAVRQEEEMARKFKSLLGPIIRKVSLEMARLGQNTDSATNLHQRLIRPHRSTPMPRAPRCLLLFHHKLVQVEFRVTKRLVVCLFS